MSDTVSLLSHKGNLAAAATWTSEPTILGQYVSLSVLVSSDQDTNVQIQFSNDLFAGGGGFVTITRSFFAGVNDYETTPVLGKWVRLSVTNVGGAPTTRLSAVVYGAPTNNSLSAKIEKVGGKAPEVDIYNSLPTSGFGDLQTVDMVPLCQYVFAQAGLAGPTSTSTPIVSLYPSLSVSHVAGAVGATYSFPDAATGLADSSCLVFDNGRAQTGSGITTDRVYGSRTRYRAGSTILSRFTARWKSDADISAWDAFTPDAAQTANAVIGVRGGSASFFTIGYRISKVYSALGSVRDPATEWGIYYNDNDLSFERYFIPSSSFNGDKFDGSATLPPIDTATLNVFEIKITYLGAASVEFKALDKNSGRMITLHTLRFANTRTRTFMGEPSIGFFAELETTGFITYGGTGSFAVSSGSFAVFSCGTRDLAFEELHCADSSVSIAAATETVILSLRNPPGTTARPSVPVGIDSISLACDGNKPVQFRVYEGGALTGGFSYSAVDAWTPVEFNVSPGVMSGGRKTVTFSLGKSDNLFIPRHAQHHLLPPGASFIITATSTQVSDVIASVSFHLE